MKIQLFSGSDAAMFLEQKPKLEICLNCTYNSVFLSSVNLVFLLCLT